MLVHAPVTSIKGVGEALAEKLARLRIKTVGDLIAHVPFRYEDFSHVSKISQIHPGPVTLKVTISGVHGRYSKRGLHMTEAIASDETGSVKLVWFNQPYRAKTLKTESEYYVSGEFAKSYKYIAITNPACELVSNFPVNTARLVPVYRLTKGLGVAQIRRTVKQALDKYPTAETLPEWLIQSRDLMPKADALQHMHFPKDKEYLRQAKKRLGFEEVFELSLASELNKREHARRHSLKIPFNEETVKKFVGKLPFNLTDDQRRSAWDIMQDMQSGQPMNRLLEGDVGSGKTVVAALASLSAITQGFQVAFMAPTALLASQHADSLKKLLSALDLNDSVVLLSRGQTASERKAAEKAIAKGSYKLIVGTHALFQETVNFDNLALVIVDEQHRFGVEQRKALQGKAREMPHVLHMTATPIPRSLALTLYADLEVSLLKTLPPGRIPIETSAYNSEARTQVYAKLSEQVQNGRQAYVVCPQIEEGEGSRLAAKTVYNQLKKTWLKNLSIGLLHGKMKPEEKDEIMASFAHGELQVLVATTVIEVGVDVGNATVMVVEGADMFGLAQLHQLRGRVGRGSYESFCYLVQSDNEPTPQRLRFLAQESNGFKLAEYDLEQRGPGAIYGTMQHGALDLRVAKLTDIELIRAARVSAREFIERGEKLLHYSELRDRVDKLRTITNLN